MCGIVGIHSNICSNDIMYETLECIMSLQHRGQDSAGIASDFTIIKHKGLVKYAFKNDDFSNIETYNCIGHVRYATNEIVDHIQPLYSTIPRRITLCHNGNIHNINMIKLILKRDFKCNMTSESDSDLILQLICCKIFQMIQFRNFDSDLINEAVEYLHQTIKGSYCIILIIQEFGMIAIRDCNGIRPFVLSVQNQNQQDEKYLVASESIAADIVNFQILRDILPGETIVFLNNGTTNYYRSRETVLTPCLFEYLYFARNDSYLEEISVHSSRISIGKLLAEKMMSLWDCSEIDVIVPVPETSITFSHGIQDVIKKPIREGFIKNRYIDRTFIMKSKQQIQKNIKRKLTGIPDVFSGKNVLIIDDSIVRGNTSKHIVNIARQHHANKIYLASCSPVIKSPNRFGIYIPTKTELISHGRTEDDIKKELGVDFLMFNDLDKIVNLLINMNSKINGFETSMFQNTE